jgi:RNA polymerase sigma-54 factor
MLKQSLKLKQLQRLSPQQIQFIQLLQVPTASLEQRIKEELEENPALEEISSEFENEAEGNEEPSNEEELDYDLSDYLEDDGVADFRTKELNYEEDDEDKESPYAGRNSFHEKLMAQAGELDLSAREWAMLEHIIGSIDADGYLRRPLLNLSDDLAFTQNLSVTEEELEKILGKIQGFDPAGVGARNLQECLLIQLKRKKRNVAINVATEIIEHHFELFTKKHFEKIMKVLELDEDLFRKAQHEIVKCNPKPGGTDDDDDDLGSIIPDFMVHVEQGEIGLKLNAKNAPELRLSKDYQEMLKDYSKQAEKDKKIKDTLVFIKSKLDSAKWFVDAIKQRQTTLLTTMDAILRHQQAYFLSGDETKLKPMILKDIADEIGMDISTISRVANSKFVHTPYGTFSLKHFFSEGIMTDSGEEVSSKEVKKILSECIKNEDKRKPVSDDKLTDILVEKGYTIARRTVAKYREQLGIPVARLRKEI